MVPLVVLKEMDKSNGQETKISKVLNSFFHGPGEGVNKPRKSSTGLGAQLDLMAGKDIKGDCEISSLEN